MGRNEATQEIVTVADAVAAMSRDMCEVEWIEDFGRYKITFPSGWVLSIGVSPTHFCSNNSDESRENDIFSAIKSMMKMIGAFEKFNEEELGTATTAEIAIFSDGEKGKFFTHNPPFTESMTQSWPNVSATLLLDIWNSIIMRNAGMNVCPCPMCVKNVRTI